MAVHAGGFGLGEDPSSPLASGLDPYHLAALPSCACDGRHGDAC